MLKDITLVIPTHNRHNYLNRLLDYYSNTKINILVCDSSENKFSDNGRYPNVIYYHYKNHTMIDKLAKVFRKVKTKYTVMCADDDFIIPEAIERCIRFLEKNKDYVSVQGHYISFYNKNNKIVYGPSYMHIIDMDINSDDATTRIRQQLTDYMDQFYCVHRTENLQTAYQYAQKKIIDYNLMELILTIVSAINGKHKILPIFYGARESIEGSAGDFTITLEKIMKMKKYRKEYEAFSDILTKHLSTNLNIPLSAAEHKLAEILQMYISNLKMEKRKRRMHIIKTIDFISCKAGKWTRRVYFELKRRKNILATKDVSGFPFYDKKAGNELKRIDYIIKKHNIKSRWRSIVI